MTTCFLAPPPVMNTFLIPGTNTPGNGVQVFFYVDGSVATKQTVYQDPAGAVPWSNPLALDSGGNIPSGTHEIWFTSGQTYKVVYAPSNDTDPPVSPYLTLPSLSGINDTGAGSSSSEWVSGPAPTFVSATSFTLVGDQTAIYTKGRRIKATVTAGTVYATITNAVFGALTTVTVSGGSLDAGLTAISYGLLDPANPSISFYEITRQATATLASGTTTNIWGTDGDSVHITGTTAVASFGVAPYAGATKKIITDSGLPITYNVSTTIVPSTSGAVTLAGEIIQIYADTVNKMIISGFQWTAKVSSFSYQMTTATMTTAITGLGFKPRAIDFYSTAQGQIGAASWGFSAEGSGSQLIFDDYASSSNTYNAAAVCILIETGVGTFQSAFVQSYDNDGFTLSFAKTGSPIGSATVRYKAQR